MCRYGSLFKINPSHFSLLLLLLFFPWLFLLARSKNFISLALLASIAFFLLTLVLGVIKSKLWYNIFFRLFRDKGYLIKHFSSLIIINMR